MTDAEMDDAVLAHCEQFERDASEIAERAERETDERYANDNAACPACGWHDCHCENGDAQEVRESPPAVRHA